MIIHLKLLVRDRKGLLATGCWSGRGVDKGEERETYLYTVHWVLLISTVNLAGFGIAQKTHI